MITYIEYMAGSGQANHHAYYSQFVNQSVRRAVLQVIGLKRLLSSTDPHLNDIPLHLWDKIAANNLIDRALFQQLHCPKYVGTQTILWSSSDNICICKAAGRMIIDEHKASSDNK